MRVRILIFLLVQLIIAGQIQADSSPYQKYNAADGYIFAASAIGGGGALLLGARIKPLTDEQIAALDRGDVNPFDRRATLYDSKVVADISDWTMRAALLLPAALFVHRDVRADAVNVGMLYLQTLAVTGMITELTKVSILRVRPYAYNPEVAVANKKAVDARKSFFSGHTSTSFAGAVFFAKVFSDYHPHSKWKPYVWAGSLGLSSVVAFSRVRAGRHFPTDVLAGAVVGGLVGYWVPGLHKKKSGGDASAMNVHAGPTFVSVRFAF